MALALIAISRTAFLRATVLEVLVTSPTLENFGSLWASIRRPDVVEFLGLHAACLKVPDVASRRLTCSTSHIPCSAALDGLHAARLDDGHVGDPHAGCLDDGHARDDGRFLVCWTAFMQHVSMTVMLATLMQLVSRTVMLWLSAASGSAGRPSCGTSR